MDTLDLFAAEQAQETATTAHPIHFHAEEPDRRAQRRITDLMEKRHVCVVAFSSGKDSSALLSLVLLSAMALKKRGGTPPPIIITHSSTGVENPIVTRIAQGELRKVREYAARHELDVRTMIGEPDLNASFPVRVIGGRALPAFASSRADCSVDWKVQPNRRLLNQAMHEHAHSSEWNLPVVMTGVRANESNARDQRIAHRGETAEGIWMNDAGDLRASPILDFETDDVWTHLGLAAAGVYDSYSNFDEVMEFYRAAGGSSCVIVADMKMAGSSKPCGARSGCWACTRIGSRDKSVEQMIESDESRYGFLKPLNRLRTWMANTQYDWGLRQYVGRTISNDGFIEIGADTYSPDTLRKLLIYTLTAEKLTGVPIISLEQLIAIDARWSMYAIAPPFTALKTYFEVVDQARMVEAPEVPLHPPSPVPKIGRIHVGSDWYEATGIGSMAGLRDTGMEIFHESCGVELKMLANGALVADYEEGVRFDVDEESAADFIAFLADDYIRDYCHHEYGDWTEGFRTYMRLGMITIGAGQSRITDEILRRSQWRQENQLHGQRSLQELEERCTVRYQRQQSLL